VIALRPATAIRALTLCLLALAMAACAPDGPAIQEVSPGKGEGNVAGDAPIRATFNHDMDRASVESRLRVDPAIAACDKTVCPVSWNGRTLTLRHEGHQFLPATRYRVTLRAGYRDTAGRVEGLEHFWEFTTEGPPSVAAVNPPDKSNGIAVDSDITIQLTRNVLVPAADMLTITSAFDAGSLTYRIAVAPDDARRLVVSPLHLLHPRTTYTLHLGAGIEDIHHSPVGVAHDYQFTTGALDLTRSLAFLVRDDSTGVSSRIAELRPPAGINSPAPSLRLLYVGSQSLRSFAWASDSSALYVLDGSGALSVAPMDGSLAEHTAISATSIAADPSRDELAYVTPSGLLHLWRRSLASGADVAVTQAGTVVGSPAWSGDGRRLSFVAQDGHGGQVLRLLDRETLSVADVPGVLPAASGTVMAWTFDGAAVAFTRPATGAPEVWAYRPLATQGDGLTRLGVIDARSLAWSSDGGVVFATGPAPGSGKRLLERALGQPVDGQAAGFSAVRGTQPGDAEPVAPSFDRRVAFVRNAAGVPQLWIMNNDGTGVSQLTFATYDTVEKLPASGIDQPRWSPGSSGG
jgi:Tol biopolymer transport system component